MPVDMIRVEGLPAPHLKRLTLEGSGDRERWTMLVAEGTLFDLPDEQLRQNALGFTPGPYRYLRVTWNDANSGRVPNPSAVAARRVSIAPPPPAATSERVDRAASERTGHQPISRQAARRQAPNRGDRARSRARRRRRARVSPGGSERVPLRGVRSRARRARTGDAVAGRPGWAHGLGAQGADCRADGDRARVDDRRWRERAAGFARASPSCSPSCRGSISKRLRVR